MCNSFENILILRCNVTPCAGKRSTEAEREASERGDNWWTLWDASLGSAKRSYVLHLAILPEAQRVWGGPDELGVNVSKTHMADRKVEEVAT